MNDIIIKLGECVEFGKDQSCIALSTGNERTTGC